MRAKRIICVFLTLVMLMSSLPLSALAAGNTPFTDVKGTDWYHDAVEYVYEEGLMRGTGETTFSPNATTTRGMIVTILHRMEGEPVARGTEFADVAEGSYCADAVAWASSKGIVTGYGNGNFGPGDAISRQQLAAILFRYADFCEKNTTSRASLGEFKDASSVAAYAVDAMQWAVAEDLIKGSGGNLNPTGLATRAQVATILQRFCNPKNTEPEKPAPSAPSGFIPNYGNNTGVEQEKCTVSFDLIFDEAIANKDAFKAQTVKKGASAKKPADPVVPVIEFKGWYTSRDYQTEYDFEAAVTEDCTVYAKWDADDTDTDQDGLYDASEMYIGTDPLVKDTDEDGLSDYQEVVLETNPLMQDTDGDGVQDYNEDADEDGVVNGKEYEFGSDPQIIDTDYDGLTDYEEVCVYKTAPDNKDTDSDGGEDGWEIENGYNPLAYDQSFIAVIESAAPTENAPISAGVAVTLAGRNIATLDVAPVSDAENPLLTPFIAGYLGPAYEFNVDGDFDEAVLTFRYDTSLGEIGSDFQPRIYHFDKETGMLIEVENQTVSDGKVTAKVGHFSSYILLNKVEFDKVWERDIKHPITDEDGDAAVLDIAFVIDNSSSMRSNDPNELSKKLFIDFVSKLRTNMDRATVIKFDKGSSVVAELTTDKDALAAAIQQFPRDGGWTNGSAGIKSAIEQLSQSESKHRYIIFLTDGKDNKYSYSYNDLIAEAKTEGIKIFSVGMGNASERVLKQLAEETGGKYYYATTSAEAEDVIDLNTVFKEIEENTIDLTTDSNRDGIPDYYNELILRGELCLSNTSAEFAGIDFNYDANGNPSADYDGDGLKNGVELKLKYRTSEDGKKQVFLTMYSDPLKKHSDADGVSDLAENKRKSNPLVADYDGNSVYSLCSNDAWYYRQFVDLYEEDAFFRATQALFGSGLTKGFKKIAKEQIVTFFHDYASDEQVEMDQAMAVALTTSEMTNDIISGLLGEIKYLKKALDMTSDIYGVISEAEALAKMKEAAALIAEYKDLGSQMYEIATYDAEWWEHGVIDAMTTLLDTQYTQAIDDVMQLDHGTEILANAYLEIGDFTKKYKDFMDKSIVSDISISDTLTLVDLGTSIAEGIITVSKVNAAKETFERNFDILEEIRDTAEHQKVSKAAQAVLDALGEGTSSYYEELAKVVAEESAQALLDEIAGTVLKKNVVYATWKTVSVILKLAGFDNKPKSVYIMLCYSDMINAAQALAWKEIVRADSTDGKYFFFEVKEEKTKDVYRYLTTAAQALMLAEKAYIDYPDTPDYNKEYAGSNIAYIQKSAEELHLPISKALLDSIS